MEGGIFAMSAVNQSRNAKGQFVMVGDSIREFTMSLTAEEKELIERRRKSASLE